MLPWHEKNHSILILYHPQSICNCTTTMPSDITLYFLGASRAIRIAWHLEELGLEYNLVASPRSPAGLGPPEFKEQIPAPLKKSPTLKDGDIVVQESGAIVEYAPLPALYVSDNSGISRKPTISPASSSPRIPYREPKFLNGCMQLKLRSHFMV